MKSIKRINFKLSTHRISPGFSGHITRLLLIIVQIFIFQSYILAQTTSSSDTLKQEISSIPVPEITRQATQVNALILEKQKNLLTEDNKALIVSRTDTLIFRINLLREDPRVHKMESLNFRNLSNLESEWSLLNSLLMNEQGDFTGLVQGLENEINLLEEIHRMV